MAVEAGKHVVVVVVRTADCEQTHVGTVSPGVSPRPRTEALRVHSLLRPAILLLLRERESHGYELVSRLAELGVEVPTNTGQVYRSLGTMAKEGRLSSCWSTAERGPARRVYAITEVGEQHLEQSISCLEALLRTLREMLNRYRRGGCPSKDAPV